MYKHKLMVYQYGEAQYLQEYKWKIKAFISFTFDFERVNRI